MSALIYFLLVAGVAYFAKLRGRSPIAWAVISLLISPLFAGIILLFLKNLATSGYKGDTIDTTAQHIPDEKPDAPSRNYQGGVHKNHEDVDTAISRIEQKLSKDKTADSFSPAASGVAGLGAATELTSSETDSAVTTSSQTDLPSEVANSSTEDITDAQVIAVSSVETASEPQAVVETSNLDQTENIQAASGSLVLEQNIETQDTQVCSQPTKFCECCGEQLKEGANFCTNCGAPIAK